MQKDEYSHDDQYFTPHVGGVARSVQSFTNGYRKRGHRVLVVAPEYENMPANDMDVVRMPAFISPTVLKVLVEKFDIKPIGEVKADVEAMMTGR